MRVHRSESKHPLGSIRIAPESLDPIRSGVVVWDVQRLVVCQGQYAKEGQWRWSSIVLEPYATLREAKVFVRDTLGEVLVPYEDW